MRLGLFILLAASTVAGAQNLIPVDNEAAIGASLARDIRARDTILDTPVVQAYLDALAAKLAPGLRPAEFPFRIAVTGNVQDGDAHEPRVLPGGYIFVSAGLVIAARDGAEFAGMLAHSMAHVTERHGTRQATRGQGTQQLATIPLIFFPGTFPANGLLLPAALERSRRDFEVEADSLAVRAAAAAGYDPEELVHYLTREQPKDGQARLQRVEEAVQALPARTYGLTVSDEFVQFQGVVRGMIPAVRERVPPRLKRR